MATINVAAAYLFMSANRFREMIDQGIVSKQASGQYELDVVRKEYILHLRAGAAGHGKAGGAGLSEARAALAKEQRESISIKNAISRGDFVSLTVVKKHLIQTFAVIRERLLTIPGKIADACDMRTRDEIEIILRGEIIEALDELHDPAEYDAGGSGDGGDDQGSPPGPETATESKPD